MPDKKTLPKACAECRRMKLRCNRQVPCNTCIKRGCGHICPDRANTTGEGHRIFRASALEMRGQMGQMLRRVRDLEDALRTSHGLHSTGEHELLTEDQLALIDPYLKRGKPTSDSSLDASVEDPSLSSPEFQDGDLSLSSKHLVPQSTVSALGSLLTNSRGSTHYLGHSASAWEFLKNEDMDHCHPMEPPLLFLPEKIRAITGSFPLSLEAALFVEPFTDFTSDFRNALPPLEEISYYQEIFFRSGTFVSHSITKEELEDDIKANILVSDAEFNIDPISFHRMSVMFMVLAIGCMMDPDKPHHPVEAEHYNQLARGTLFCGNVLHKPTPQALQAMNLMITYLSLVEPETATSNVRWNIMGLMVRISQKMGLHRDPAGFGFSPQKQRYRRRVFWDIVYQDSAQALRLGLPPALTASGYDVEFPISEDPPVEHLYFSWKRQFLRDCIEDVHNHLLSAGRPSHQFLLQLDAKLRAYPLPPQLRMPIRQPDSFSHIEGPLLVQLIMANVFKEGVILTIHRNSFETATNDFRANPLNSPYSASIVAAFRSAWAVIFAAAMSYKTQPYPLDKIWEIWETVFSSAVVLGMLVKRCPQLGFAPQALAQLSIAKDVLTQVAPKFGNSVHRVVDVVTQLYEDSRTSLATLQSSGATQSGSSIDNLSEFDDEFLSQLGSKTHLVKHVVHPKPKEYMCPRAPSPSSLDLPARSQIHPSLRKYLEIWELPHSANYIRPTNITTSPTLYYDQVPSIGPSEETATNNDLFIGIGANARY